MKSRDIDSYIATFPKDVQALLNKVRRTVRAAAPGAREVISYNMPAFRQRRMLVYFAGFKSHIGLYPPVRGNAALERAVAKYAGPKGNLKFPYDRRLPLALITRILRHKVKQDGAKAPARKKEMKAERLVFGESSNVQLPPRPAQHRRAQGAAR